MYYVPQHVLLLYTFYVLGDTFQANLQLIGVGYMHLRSQALNLSVSYVEDKTRTGVRDGTTFSAIGTTFSAFLGPWVCSNTRLLCLEILSGPKIEEKDKINNWICKDITDRMKCQAPGKYSQILLLAKRTLLVSSFTNVPWQYIFEHECSRISYTTDELYNDLNFIPPTYGEK
jgi:hypothetical protein